MESSNYLLMNNSILYRCAQKFYDKQLEHYQIGAGQILFLIMIYENEGITMQNLACKGAFDKGTITKGIQKLEELGYVKSVPGKDDKRVRQLYTSDKTKNIISELYLIRRQWWERLTKNLSQEEIDLFEEVQEKITQNAMQYDVEEDEKSLKIFGMQKLTLLDYPGKMACTIFTGGCNFRCPFCHNGDLVFLPENMAEMSVEDILSFLKRRVSILEGVCISGGEPLLQAQLTPFLRKVKELGYQIKLDTNGTNPEKLKELVEEGLIDYVAMDIKNDPSHYAETAGIHSIDMTRIEKSVQYLLQGNIPYEFRTTIVKEYHTKENMEAIGQWLKGARAYYLQNFEDGECVIKKGLHACEKEELEAFAQSVKAYIPNTAIRGI